ncbi:MAG: hypothetical protein DRJ50_02605, partial [Actinobacteria bacterium]
MSPRDGGGGRVIADPPPGRQQMQDPNATAPVADTPPYQYGRKTWTGGGLPGSASSSPERTVAFSATILDSIIPFVYGERRAIGMAAGRDDWDGHYRPFAFLFAFGEQDSITDVQINGEAIGDLDWVIGLQYRYGTGSETIPTGYTDFGDNDDWKKYAYICFKMDTWAAEVPGSLDVTAVLGGQKCYNPWTTVTEVTSNPAIIAYDIQTSDNWKGLAAGRIDVD